MSDLNDVKLFGRIVKDATIQLSNNDKKKALFTLAVNRTKKDENGNYIQDAEDKVKIKAVNSSRPNDSETKANSSVISDNKGAYQTSDGKCDGINNYEKLKYEVITTKTG